jgi:UDP-N-acetylmuramate-alanine ligase
LDVRDAALGQEAQAIQSGFQQLESQRNKIGATEFNTKLGVLQNRYEGYVSMIEKRNAIAAAAKPEFLCMDNTEAMLVWLKARVQSGDHVVIMSNGGFEGLHQRLLAALRQG